MEIRMIRKRETHILVVAAALLIFFGAFLGAAGQKRVEEQFSQEKFRSELINVLE